MKVVKNVLAIFLIAVLNSNTLFSSCTKCCAVSKSSVNNSLSNVLYLKDEYCSGFDQDDCSEIIIENTREDDIKRLNIMLENGGKEISQYLGLGASKISVDDLLGDNISLTIKNLENKILGQIILGKGSDLQSLSVTYWIGKEFRGRGYASFAVSKVIEKIWGIDDKLIFEFQIDNNNIVSIRTLEKIAANLKIDSIKKEFHTVKIQAKKASDISYFLSWYVDRKLLPDSPIITKKDLLKKYSEDQINNGIILNSTITTYLLKAN